MVNGVDFRGITTSRGNVSVSKLDCYYNNGTCTTDSDDPQKSPRTKLIHMERSPAV